jgi:hypothetical protein
MYPDVVDATHATREAVAFFRSFFTAKSTHNPALLMEHFSAQQIAYIDATLGAPFYSHGDLGAVFESFMPKWPPAGLSYPTRILGDTDSALVTFTDTPELFGGEIRIMAAVNFKNDKVIRWIDYWDSRNFGSDTVAKMRRPPDKFPSAFSEATTAKNMSARIQDVTLKLAAALTGGDVATASAIFSYDAVYEDMTLRTQILGRLAITRYLSRAAARLPYGAGASVAHIVGSDKGGGYEWRASAAYAATVRRGITALVLDSDGQISRLTTVWDGGMISDSDLQSLLLLSLD